MVYNFIIGKEDLDLTNINVGDTFIREALIISHEHASELLDIDVTTIVSPEKNLILYLKYKTQGVLCSLLAKKLANHSKEETDLSQIKKFYENQASFYALKLKPEKPSRNSEWFFGNSGQCF